MVYVPDWWSDPCMFERRADREEGWKSFGREDLIKELAALGIIRCRIERAMTLAVREPMRVFYPEPTDDKSVSVKLENGTWKMKVH